MNQKTKLETEIDLLRKLKTKSIKAANTGTWSAASTIASAAGLSIIVPGLGPFIAGGIAALGATVTTAALVKKISEDKKGLEISNIVNDKFKGDTKLVDILNLETSKMEVDKIDLNKFEILVDTIKENSIKGIAKKYKKDYEILSIKKEQLTTNLTDQIYFEVSTSQKFDALCWIIDIEHNFYGLIFCRTEVDVDKIGRCLIDRGYDADVLHGDISQSQRETILNKFKSKKTNILLTTDVAARGIDINDLTHVINFSLPQDPEYYVRRIGMTGKTGKEGTAITFVTPDEYGKLLFIQEITKAKIRKEKIPKVKEIIDSKKNRIKTQLDDNVKGELIGKSYSENKGISVDKTATAKDEVIRSKDATIENLKEQVRSLEKINPMKFREYFESVKLQLEEYNDSLHSDLQAAIQEIEQRNAEIEKLRSKGKTTQETVKRLESERSKFQEVTALLEKEMEQLREKKASEAGGVIPVPQLDQNLMHKTVLLLDNLDQMQTWRSVNDKLTSESIRRQILLSQNILQRSSSPMIFVSKLWDADPDKRNENDSSDDTS